MQPVLDHGHHHEAPAVLLAEPGHPGVVAVLVGHVVAHALHLVGQAHHLGGAGLGADHHARSKHPAAGAVRVLHGGDHGPLDHGRVFRGQGDGALHLWGHAAHELRLQDLAAVDEGGDDARHLQRGHSGVALADGQVQVLALGPAHAKAFHLPLARGDEPALLVGQVDARGRAQPGFLGVGADAVHAELHAELVEIGVAGLDQGALEVDCAVAAALPAAEHVAAQGHLARAVHGFIGVDGLLVQGSCGHEQLEDRARRIHALGGAVLQGVHGVVAQLRPLGRGQPGGEGVGVIRGLADQGVDLARVRVHDHHASGLALEHLVPQLLQAQVDAEEDLLAGLGFALQLLREPAPGDVDLDQPPALGSAQAVIQAVLQALLAHEVAQGQGRVGLHLGLVGLGHVAEHVGEQVPVNILAPGAREDFDPRPAQAATLDQGDVLEVQVRHQGQGLEGFHLGLVAGVDVLQALRRDARPLRDLIQGGRDVVAVLAHEAQHEGRLVDGQKLAVPVAQEAARSEDVLGAQLVVAAFFGEHLAQMDLQVPQAHGKEAEQPEDQALQESHAQARRFLAVGAMQILHGPSSACPGTWHRRHTTRPGTAGPGADIRPAPGPGGRRASPARP